MIHTRYLVNNKAVCEKPEMLDGTNFIVVDYEPGDTEYCQLCMQLVTAHNKKQYEREALVNFPQSHSSSEPFSPSTEIMVGIGIASLFWLVVILGLWLMFEG